MKPYGLKAKIREGNRKNRSHCRHGNECGICHNTKISKGAERKKNKINVKKEA